MVLASGVFKLWLDARRPLPDGSWIQATTVEDAKSVLLTKRVEEASFDFRFPLCEKCQTHKPERCMCNCHQTARDLLDWISKMKLWPKTRPIVHCEETSVREVLEELIDKLGPYGTKEKTV